MTFGYIGSKYKLLDFIHSCASKHIKITDKTTFGDLFAGTGVVGNYFKNKYGCQIISNDMELYSYHLNNALLNCSYSEKLQLIIDKLNNNEYSKNNDNLITQTYCNYKECNRNFFSVENGLKIDYCMGVIKTLQLTPLEYSFLIASLLTAVNKIANTTGVYGAYLKHIKKAAQNKLLIKPIHTSQNKDNNKVYNENIENIKEDIDVLYLDPPYSSRQYASNYFLLNYIILYDKNVKIKGKTGIIEDWNRSNFCSKPKIKKSLEKVLNNVKCRYLLFSYSNEGLLSIDELKDIFKTYFKEVYVYQQEYNRYKSARGEAAASRCVSKTSAASRCVSKTSAASRCVIEYLFVCSNV